MRRIESLPGQAMDSSSQLSPADRHYKAYVGPRTQYDFMGATQFRLLCTLGLRAHHRLLDFGCGSLRAGRLFMPYLDEGRYFGIEPNQWLIDEAVKNQIGADMVRIKRPRFAHNGDFATDVFSEHFDFIMAQSIFTHARPDLITKALGNFRDSLLPHGLVAATFVEGKIDSVGSGWVYPGCVEYKRNTIAAFVRAAGLHVVRIPWYHPRSAWYLMAKERRFLPSPAMLRQLRGAVLFDPEFIASWSLSHEVVVATRRFLGRTLPRPLSGLLEALISRSIGGTG
jgi:SAM-dependent methyltransferase